MSAINLEKLLDFKNDHIIARYQSDYPNSKLSAKEALTEWLKYVWLCHDHAAAVRSRPDDSSLRFSCVIHAEMSDIDNMWHTFLLFTLDYHDFCSQYLNGQFFHHVPLTTQGDNMSVDKYESDLTNYLSYIYDRLGEATVLTWFCAG